MGECLLLLNQCGRKGESEIHLCPRPLSPMLETEPRASGVLDTEFLPWPPVMSQHAAHTCLPLHATQDLHSSSWIKEKSFLMGSAGLKEKLLTFITSTRRGRGGMIMRAGDFCADPEWQLRPTGLDMFKSLREETGEKKAGVTGHTGELGMPLLGLDKIKKDDTQEFFSRGVVDIASTGMFH